MNNNRTSILSANNRIKQWVWSILVLFVVLLFVFSSSTPGWVVFIQLFLAFEFVFAFVLLQKSTAIQIIFTVGALLLMNTVCIRFLFTDNGVHPFGPEPADSLTYLSMSMKARSQSIGDYLHYLKGQDINIDDYGMLLVGRFAALIGGSDSGYMAVLVLFNVVALMVSTYFIYKTARLLLQHQTSLLATIIWGLHQGFVGFSVFGLKENIFLVFVVLAIFYLIRYVNYRKINDLVFGALFVLITCLFRLAVGAQLFLALLIAMIISRVSRARLVALILLASAAILIIINLDQLIIFVGGHGLEAMLEMGEENASSIGTQQSYFANIIYGIIGTPARFKGTIGFNHLMNFSSLIFSIISVFYVYNITQMFKKIQSTQLFLFVYWLLGVGMLMLVLRGGDFRFSSMYIPSILLLSGVGYEKSGEKKWFKTLSICWIIPVLIITILWNR